MDIKGLEAIEGKVCSKCGTWKLLEEYNKNKTNKDGRQSKCRECQKEYKKQWSKNNKEHRKEYNKEYMKQWRENNKEHKKEYDKQYYQNNKEQIKE